MADRKMCRDCVGYVKCDFPTKGAYNNDGELCINYVASRHPVKMEDVSANTPAPDPLVAKLRERIEKEVKCLADNTGGDEDDRTSAEIIERLANAIRALEGS